MTWARFSSTLWSISTLLRYFLDTILYIYSLNAERIQIYKSVEYRDKLFCRIRNLLVHSGKRFVESLNVFLMSFLDSMLCRTRHLFQPISLKPAADRIFWWERSRCRQWGNTIKWTRRWAVYKRLTQRQKIRELSNRLPLHAFKWSDTHNHTMKCPTLRRIVR